MKSLFPVIPISRERLEGRQALEDSINHARVQIEQGIARKLDQEFSSKVFNNPTT